MQLKKITSFRVWMIKNRFGRRICDTLSLDCSATWWIPSSRRRGERWLSPHHRYKEGTSLEDHSACRYMSTEVGGGHEGLVFHTHLRNLKTFYCRWQGVWKWSCCSMGRSCCLLHWQVKLHGNLGPDVQSVVEMLTWSCFKRNPAQKASYSNRKLARCGPSVKYTESEEGNGEQSYEGEILPSSGEEQTDKSNWRDMLRK